MPDGSNLDAHRIDMGPIQVRMLLSFQRPPRPVGEGIPPLMALPSGIRSGPDS